MILIALTFAFLFALILTILFYFIFGLKTPWKGYKYFFLIIFLVSFAAGEWVIPAGPVAWGYYWLPALITAILIAILLAAIGPKLNDSHINNQAANDYQSSVTTTQTNSSINTDSNKIPIYSGKETEEGAVLGALFWIFLLLLLISGIIGYLYA